MKGYDGGAECGAKKAPSVEFEGHAETLPEFVAWAKERLDSQNVRIEVADMKCLVVGIACQGLLGIKKTLLVPEECCERGVVDL
ncbi:hypothetical protein AA103581_0313 [Gluconobacter wancherniae NBRC 103581]|nr:hypothetical protein AA103581_0313 [Gluconobacter wancherniae NBRC 103581]